jgi:hypothetical protein
MHKILLSIVILTSFIAQSQEVSPYYPAKYVGEKGAGFTSQMTYFDLNFISSNVSDFLMSKMLMNIENTDSSKMLFDGGKLTITYTDRIVQSKAQKLIISYDVVKVNDVYTIKSVKMTGDKERLLDFFIVFWETTINFKAPSGNSDVSLNMGQDIVKYYFNKGKPYITVTNSTYKNLEEFKVYFETLKAENK